MLRTAVLVSGGGTNLQAIIDAIAAGNIYDTSIEVVISNNKGAYALERAERNNIPAVSVSPNDYASRDEFNDALASRIDEYSPDLIVLAGFLVVLPQTIIRKYVNRIINIHPALIPAFSGRGYYGLKVHEAALKRGVRITGATVHFVDEGTDTGPIIFQKAVEVREDDTPAQLQRRVMEEAEWVILPRAIDHIARGKINIKDGKVHVI